MAPFGPGAQPMGSPGSQDTLMRVGREKLNQQRERNAKLASPASKRERADSRTAHDGLGDGAAVDLLRGEFSALLKPMVPDAETLLAGSLVTEFLDDYTVRVTATKREPGRIIDSQIPLRAPAEDQPGAPKKPVDLDLVASGEGFAPDNGVADLELPDQVADGVQVGPVTVTPAGQAGVERVDSDTLAYPNLATDTDFAVNATPTGFESFHQLRSPKASEVQRLRVALPAGSELRLLEGHGVDKRDGAEVVRGGKQMMSVSPPVAVDAQGRDVPTTLKVEGKEVVIETPHRDKSFAYPILVDPEWTVKDDWACGFGSTNCTDTWFHGHGYSSPSNEGPILAGLGQWGFSSNMPWVPYAHDTKCTRTFFNYTCEFGESYGGGHNWDGPSGLKSYGDTGLHVWGGSGNTYPAGSNAFYYYQSPGWTSRITRVDFGAKFMRHQGNSGWLIPFTGIYSYPMGNWVPGAVSFYGGAEDGVDDGRLNHHWNAHIAGDYPGAQYAAFGVAALYNSPTDGYSNMRAYMGGAIIQMTDPEAPTLTNTDPTGPGGWAKAGDSYTFSPTAQDLGLGVKRIRLTTPNGIDRQRLVFCNGARTAPCPPNFKLEPGNPSIIQDNPKPGDQIVTRDPNTGNAQADPITIQADNLPEGQTPITLEVSDAIGGTGHDTAVTKTVKVDRSRPTASLAGIGNGEMLRDRTYQLTATGQDQTSGTKSVHLTLDGAELAESTTCPAAPAPCEIQANLEGGDSSLAEGEHTLVVTSTDHAGNATTSTSTFNVERQKPELDVEGSLKPLSDDASGDWVSTGEQGLSIDATDAQSGVTDLAVYIDGSNDPISTSPTQACPDGGCDYFDDLTFDTSQLQPGPHQVIVAARDGAGNRATLEWTIRVERTNPGLVLTGDLLAGTPLDHDGHYTVTATATDVASGMGTVAFSVDDDAPVVMEQRCANGGCSMSRSFDYLGEDRGPGPHTVKVTATDLAGNATTETKTVTGEDEPDPGCPSSVEPTTVIDSNPRPVGDALADLTSAFEPAVRLPAPATVDGDTVKPAVAAAGTGGLLESVDALSQTGFGRGASGAAMATLDTEQGLICLLPDSVGSQSSPATSPDDAAAFFANSLPDTDTLLRPLGAGTEVISQLRSPAAAHSVSWQVGMPAGDELKALPNGMIAVVDPLDADAAPPETDDTVGAGPSASERQAAVGDATKQLDQASDDLERHQAATGDQIVAVIPEPWARDKNGQDVATTVTATGSRITMSVSPPPAAAFPLVASWQMTTTDAANEYETQKAASDTEELDGDQQAALATSSDTSPTTPPAEDPGEFDDNGDNQSGSSDDDVVTSDDTDEDATAARTRRDPTQPLRGAAKDNLPDIKFGLTESDPANLSHRSYLGPNGLRSKWPYLRPVVPYNLSGVKANPNASKYDDADRLALKRWNAYYAKLVQNGWKADIAFARPRKTTKHRIARPTARGYGKAISAFFENWPGVTTAISAWNEPNYGPSDGIDNDDPLKAAPKLAGELWVVAARRCFPKNPHANFKRPCNTVIAGEFAGKPNETKRYRGPGAKTVAGYTDTYNAWLRHYAKQRQLRRPSRWGFHAYGDTKAYLLKRSNSRFDAPITHRYAEKFKEPNYRVDDKAPEVWMSAAGAGYHYDCGMIGDEALRKKYCGGREEPRVLLGKASQRDAGGFLVRSVAKFSRIKRFYYFNHKTAPGLAAKCSLIPPGDNTKLTCGRDEWGLIGAYDDNSYRTRSDNTQDENDRVKAFGSGLSDYSVPDEQRPIFCLLRGHTAKEISYPKRTKCPPNPPTQ